jgi:hypothetical protein
MRASLNINFPLRGEQSYGGQYVWPEVTPQKWEEIVDQLSRIRYLDGMKVEFKCK